MSFNHMSSDEPPTLLQLSNPHYHGFKDKLSSSEFSPSRPRPPPGQLSRYMRALSGSRHISRSWCYPDAWCWWRLALASGSLFISLRYTVVCVL